MRHAVRVHLSLVAPRSTRASRYNKRDEVSPTQSALRSTTNTRRRSRTPQCRRERRRRRCFWRPLRFWPPAWRCQPPRGWPWPAAPLAAAAAATKRRPKMWPPHASRWSSSRFSANCAWCGRRRLTWRWPPCRGRWPPPATPTATTRILSRNSMGKPTRSSCSQTKVSIA